MTSLAAGSCGCSGSVSLALLQHLLGIREEGGRKGERKKGERKEEEICSCYFEFVIQCGHNHIHTGLGVLGWRNVGVLISGHEGKGSVTRLT